MKTILKVFTLLGIIIISSCEKGEINYVDNSAITRGQPQFNPQPPKVCSYSCSPFGFELHFTDSPGCYWHAYIALKTEDFTDFEYKYFGIPSDG